MAKKRVRAKRGGKSALRGVGKITFVYFSGDVGEFIDALTAKLKEPGVAEKVAEAINIVSTAAAKGVGADGAVQ